MSDPLIFWALGYLNGLISIGEISLLKLEGFSTEDCPVQPDAIITTIPDSEISEFLERFAKEITTAFSRNPEGLSIERIIKMMFNFGSRIATGQISADSIANLCGLSKDELEKNYFEAMNKMSKGTIL